MTMLVNRGTLVAPYVPEICLVEHGRTVGIKLWQHGEWLTVTVVSGNV